MTAPEPPSAARPPGQESQLQLQLLLDHMPDGVLAFDSRGTIEWINPAARLIFQRGAADCVGRSITELIPRIGSALAQLERSYAASRPSPLASQASPQAAAPVAAQVPRFALEGLRRGAAPVPIEVALVVWPSARGERGLCVCRDTSEMERVDRLKREFVTMVSHELRTPLTSLRGSLALLTDGSMPALPPPAERLLRLAHLNAERLVSLVNDILDFEKLRAGALRVQVAPLDLPRALQRAVESIESLAQQAGVAVELAFEPASDGETWEALADPERLMQVLVNLLSNAIKHSPPGARVRIELAQRAERLRVTVADQGPGVAGELLPRLFEPFAQAHDAARSKPGTGLGLAISRALMELMQGGIGLDAPRAGAGARFWIELPSNALRPSTFGAA